LGHAKVSRIMTLKSKRFRKYEVCDGLYKFLSCVINVLKNFKVHHIISKRIFSITKLYKIKMLKKVENKAPLTWTWKMMSTFSLFQSFCAFVQVCAFKNT